MLAIGPQQQPLLAQFGQLHRRRTRQSMLRINQEDKVLRKQGPGVQSVPPIAKVRGDTELGFTVFQIFENLGGSPAKEPAIEPLEVTAYFVQVRHKQIDIEGVG